MVYEKAKSKPLTKEERRLQVLLNNRDVHLSMYTTCYRSGGKYVGTCKGGVPHGFGKRYFVSGDWYEGDWKLGKAHGCGVYFEAATHTTYDGEWRLGMRDGEGSSCRTFLGNSVEYYGRWEKDKQHGEGTVTWTNGSDRVMKGEWKHGELIKVHEDRSGFNFGSGFVESSRKLDFPSSWTDAQLAELAVSEEAEEKS
mmetsp:Transcript_19014/g.31106  ORF Transcript_19014/g.31106 Transcript_19014/m.31106 type:complete len:197 (+) Transcript_19014:150-740(+)|eukprot:CAMPEP_0203769902 /NCGR_PEP_ID=MMETSP0099_2-20121227/2478_1 /ASSEMBLY_ACC=CAM_ASM_000209 /TAXON_ID=96639 /ORGANISM=" , Strain NY0313808BC1" /LENGTH=196 /DNA_ID=CAMNT_0050666909 /DNA_START=80 /DNA_END=670 /DNA_ORIENTATION=+